MRRGAFLYKMDDHFCVFCPYTMILERRTGVLPKLRATNPIRDHYTEYYIGEGVSIMGMLVKQRDPRRRNKNMYKFNQSQPRDPKKARPRRGGVSRNRPNRKSYEKT